MTRKFSSRMSIGLLVLVVIAMAVIAVEDARICKVPKGEEEGEEEMEGICNGIDVAMTEEILFVDGHRLQQQIDELSSFSDTPAPSVTRILFTENDVAARSALPCGDDVYEKIFTESFCSEESFGFCH